MKILMLGGTGILSTDVCKTAIAKGHSVYILNRGKRRYALQKDANLIICDILKEPISQIKSKLKGLFFDVVIDFLAFNTSDLCRHLEIIKGHCCQYIFISSATAYKKRSEDEIISESETPIGNPQWDYAYNKFLCENYLRSCYVKYCEHWTVIRPYVTYNETRIPYAIIPGNANWTLLKRILEGKPIVIWDSGNAKCTITNSKDFSIGVVGLFNNTKAYEEAFHITSSYVMNWKQVLSDVIAVIDKKVDIIDIPTSYIINVLPEYKGVLLGDKATNMVFDNSKIRSVVPEFKSSIPFDVGIKETITYFYEHQELQVVDFKWEGRLDYLILKYYKDNSIKHHKKLDIQNYKANLKEKLKYYSHRNIFIYRCYSSPLGRMIRLIIRWILAILKIGR